MELDTPSVPILCTSELPPLTETNKNTGLDSDLASSSQSKPHFLYQTQSPPLQNGCKLGECSLQGGGDVFAKSKPTAKPSAPAAAGCHLPLTFLGPVGQSHPLSDLSGL